MKGPQKGQKGSNVAVEKMLEQGILLQLHFYRVADEIT
jgi:hypothetical protein